MKRKAITVTAALFIVYIGFEFVSFHRTLAKADLPAIPLGITLNYPGGAASNEPFTVVMLGNSTAQGIGAARPEDSFGALVAQHLARQDMPVRFVNLGVSGAQGRDVLAEQVPQVAALDPDLILLSVGANDVTAWTAPSAYLETMEQIARELDRTGAVVAALNVPATIAAPLLPYPVRLVLDARTRRYNDGLARMLGGREMDSRAYIRGGARAVRARSRDVCGGQLPSLLKGICTLGAYHPARTGS